MRLVRDKESDKFKGTELKHIDLYPVSTLF